MNKTLKDLAEKHNLLIGTAVGAKRLNDPICRPIITREFNIITCENAMKFRATHPKKDEYTFADADTIVEFAQKNKMKIRGHTLAWDKSLPDWLIKGNLSSNQVKKILEDHVRKVVGHFKGKLLAWDVINEPIHHHKFGPENFWYEKIGPEYIELVFRWTHETDHNAKLFINEWGMEEIGEKSDVMFSLIKNLLKNGVPIHGIGFQMHRGIGDPKLMDGLPDLKSTEDNFKRFADLGLEIHVTEMDIQTYGYKGSQKEIFDAQGRAYGDIVKTILKIPAVKALVFWGVFDKYSWIPYCFKHPDCAHLYDEDFEPKPAYFAIGETLS